MPPGRLAALVARTAVYALVASCGALLLHARDPANALGATFVVLTVGIWAFAAARAAVRRR